MRDAMRWAPEDPVVREVGVRLADAWAQQGELAFTNGNLDDAHRLWSDALAADPLRPWLRRRVEELRVRRLELHHEGGAAPPPDEADREG